MLRSHKWQHLSSPFSHKHVCPCKEKRIVWIYEQFLFNVYLFLRETEAEHEWGRGRERGRHRIGSRRQARNCRRRAGRRARTHEPRDHDLSRSQMLHGLRHQVPPSCGFLKMGSCCINYPANCLPLASTQHGRPFRKVNIRATSFSLKVI